MRRRQWLTGITGAALLGLSGCLDDEPDPDEDDGGASVTDGETVAGTDVSDGEESTEPEWPTGRYAAYETTDITVCSSGNERGSVLAAIAETPQRRYVGLSDADILPDDGGLLFVYEEPDDRVFVMREMDFGIDIIYVDENREITDIHHARAPAANEDGESLRYPGYGQYVLEVNYHWTTSREIDVGDRLLFTNDL